MPTAGVRVLVIGRLLDLPDCYDIRHVSGTADVFGAIAQFQPDVILTSDFVPGALRGSAFELRKRWLHTDPGSDRAALVQAVESCYAHVLWAQHPYEHDNPLVSVYTPTHNTGDYLRDTYQSLREQTHTNWEWVVVDDASTDGTWARLEQLAAEDHRVRPVRNALNCGKIGGVKDQATRLARGEFLVELDHDDMLTDFALAEVVAAFREHPDAGMVYSNCSNFFEDGNWHRFTDGFWKDRYHEEEYRGRTWVVCEQPDIYERFGPDFKQQFGWFLTVGPNHVRAYRASTFRELGGYNPGLPVADDWDLYVRFFLRSKCVLIPKLLYLYRFRDNWANATFTRNQSIQDHLELGRRNYTLEAAKFNERRLRGGADDPRPLLTVAVCAIAERADTSLPGVVAELRRQAEGRPVEILCVLDNKARSLAEKRNTIIRAAKGDFVAFVDDDDRVESDYCEEILGAIREAPDADVVCFDVAVHGVGGDRVCRYGVDYEDRDETEVMFRRPNHVMAWRTAVAREIPYRDTWEEDDKWAVEARDRVRGEARVDRVLYHYDFDPVTTTQRETPGRQATLDVSYVVLVASTETPAKRCLESIRAHSLESEIVLVANGVDLPDDLRALADRVVDSEINLGFAAGCNVGAEHATRPLLCFLNDDAAFVESDTPRRLAEAVSAESAIVAPYSNRAKWPQGDVGQWQTPAEDAWPEAVVGLCMVLSAKVFHEVGGFDPRLLTWEDDAFCARARALGHRCRVVASTWVDHERHVTFRALGLDVDQVMRENQEKFCRLHPRVRVVAIAKNEAGCIADFFEQFRPLTTDWCLLDTGSEDDTVRLAKEVGVRVEEAPFVDFAASRNEALDRFSDDVDWIVMLDADERLDPDTILDLQGALAQAEYDIYLAPLRAVYADDSTKEFVAKPFVFRADPGIRWVFKAHEKLVGSLRQAIVRSARIDHLLPLHDGARREASEGLYHRLMSEEPYHTDLAYRNKMRAEWPILDYDRLDDLRLAKVHFGPLVTVVVPTHDRPELLNRAVRSALAQDYYPLDIVVVHDGPPASFPADHSWGLLPRADCVREHILPQNHGAGGAVPRNYALWLAAGPLISYLDDDNAWKSDHVSSVVMAMRGADVPFGYSSMEVDGKDMKFDLPPAQFRIDTSCVVHDRALVARRGYWKNREEGGYAHDWEFFSRMVADGTRAVCTRRPTLIYNAETSGQRDFLVAMEQS